MCHKILASAVIVFCGIVSAQISVQVCDPCDLTPISIDQVMVGKKCSLLVVSDVNDIWSGGLFLSGESRDIGKLSGRGRDPNDPNSRDCKDSHLESAGLKARVYSWNDSYIGGVDFYTCERHYNIDGPWFVVDYEALDIGDCTVDFYDHSLSWTIPDPKVLISIENIPYVDFYVDNVVDMKDFMILASHWLEEDCSDPNWCQQTDIDKDGTVDISDITIFAEYWLWPTPGSSSSSSSEPNDVNDVTDPNEESFTEVAEDPNVIYRIQDANDLQFITLTTGETVRLYLTLETMERDVYIVFLEVDVADPNMGWIDNTEYNEDPNNNTGTAEILATPRMSVFDYYGPGGSSEDMVFTVANIEESISDGPIASFLYTATAPGTVVLTLNNYMDPVQLEPIVIYQVDDSSSALTDPNDIAEFLQTVWNESEDLQSTTTQEEWDTFIESVLDPNS